MRYHFKLIKIQIWNSNCPSQMLLQREKPTSSSRHPDPKAKHLLDNRTAYKEVPDESSQSAFWSIFVESTLATKLWGCWQTPSYLPCKALDLIWDVPTAIEHAWYFSQVSSAASGWTVTLATIRKEITPRNVRCPLTKHLIGECPKGHRGICSGSWQGIWEEVQW